MYRLRLATVDGQSQMKRLLILAVLFPLFLVMSGNRFNMVFIRIERWRFSLVVVQQWRDSGKLRCAFMTLKKIHEPLRR